MTQNLKKLHIELLPALVNQSTKLSSSTIQEFINSFLMVTGKIFVMTETLLNVFGPCERHSNQQRFVQPSEANTKGRYSLLSLVNWATNRNWQTKVLGGRKVTQLNLLRQESVNLAANSSVMYC